MSSALSLQGKHQSQNSNASLKSNVKLNEESRFSPNINRESEIKSNSAKGLSGLMDPRYYRDVNDMQMFDRQKYHDDISNTFRELSADFKSKYKVIFINISNYFFYFFRNLKNYMHLINMKTILLIH